MRLKTLVENQTVYVSDADTQEVKRTIPCDRYKGIKAVEIQGNRVLIRCSDGTILNNYIIDKPSISSVLSSIAYITIFISIVLCFWSELEIEIRLGLAISGLISSFGLIGFSRIVEYLHEAMLHLREIEFLLSDKTKEKICR